MVFTNEIVEYKKIYKEIRMKKVSVIVPFYNVEEYIERSIKSLLEQSLEEIEIILVNDRK